MDKPIAEWKRHLRGMEAEKLLKNWKMRAKSKISWVEECNYHVAAAERMKQLGNMAIDLDDDSRKNLCIQATEILEKLQDSLSDKPHKLAEIDEVASHSDAYYEKFGTRTARYYMYEQGVIDLLGDRKAG